MSGLTPTRQAALQAVASGSVVIQYIHPGGWTYMSGFRKYRKSTCEWLHENGYIKILLEDQSQSHEVVLTEKGRAAL